MPQRPLLIYDGNCSFCRIWIDYWRQLTGDQLNYAASQDVAAQYPQITKDDFAKSVQLVRTDGSVASGALAVFESLGKKSWYRWLGAPAEFAYRLVAGHRDFFYQATKWTFGTQIHKTQYQSTQWLFLRALALVYLIAFTSLVAQVTGLLGERGILPLNQFLAAVAQSGGAIRYAAVPSLFWIASDNTVLQGLCWSGVAISAVLFLSGFFNAKAERLALILLYVLYLSFSAVGQEFLSFQWDSLLLESGFLAIFLGRNRLVPWLFRALVFRLYFLSGIVKLSSGDATWPNLSALRYHWYTQPLPTPLAWYMDKLPDGMQTGMTLFTLVIEIAAPFCIFLPRRIRMAAAWVLITLQLLILLTGNYTFFNILAIGLTLFLFDDAYLQKLVDKLRGTSTKVSPEPSGFALKILASLILAFGSLHILQPIAGGLPIALQTPLRYIAPFGMVNSYGLFAVMTTERLEITVEGSADGETWKPYQFRYKPQNLNQAPAWVAPHQPRLDWQMWFAALGTIRENPWFANLAVSLLRGTPDVVALLKDNPFPDSQPVYVRARLERYRFSTAQEKAATGNWWHSESAGEYLPRVSLRGQ